MARVEPSSAIRWMSERVHFSEKELERVGPFSAR